MGGGKTENDRNTLTAVVVYFVSSDEAGSYRETRTDEFLKRYPYYSRCGLMIEARDWPTLRTRFMNTKESCGIPVDFELKFQDLWDAKIDWKRFARTHTEVKHLNYQDLQSFVRKSLDVLARTDSFRIIFTVTKNDSVGPISQDKIWKWHLQNIMQRVEMQICKSPSNLAVFFLDNINEATEKKMRKWYYELLRGGDLLEYNHIKDSVSFEYSHHSSVMQLADFCVGVFNGCLRDFTFSRACSKAIIPKIVSSKQGEIMGYGVCEIPTDSGNVKRLWIKRRLLGEDA